LAESKGRGLEAQQIPDFGWRVGWFNHGPGWGLKVEARGLTSSIIINHC
jgi:hypothetical protein